MANAGDWVEFYNATNQAIDISGYTFKDGDDAHQFQIPSNTLLASHAYFVVVADSFLFQNRFGGVTNFAGSFPFGLSMKGEAVRLFDQTGKLIQSVYYDEMSPWPSGANAQGYTLELSNYASNLNLGTSWQDGCVEGSPGAIMLFPCITTSISNTSQDVLSVYPNPSFDKFRVHLASEDFVANHQVEVFDYFGRKVSFSKSLFSQDLLEITLPTEAPVGMYLLRITLGDKQWEKVMMKK
jgi:hypothetical protein